MVKSHTKALRVVQGMRIEWGRVVRVNGEDVETWFDRGKGIVYIWDGCSPEAAAENVLKCVRRILGEATPKEDLAGDADDVKGMSEPLPEFRKAG